MDLALVIYGGRRAVLKVLSPFMIAIKGIILLEHFFWWWKTQIGLGCNLRCNTKWSVDILLFYITYRSIMYCIVFIKSYFPLSPF